MLNTGSRVTKQDILSIVTELDIFRFYAPPFRLGNAMKSPLRTDHTPSFTIKMSSVTGKPYYMDYADDNYQGDCFKFVQQMYSCNYGQALEKIYNEVCNRRPVDNSNRIVLAQKSAEQAKEQVEKEIAFDEQPFTQADIAWWGSFGITVDDLIREGIKSVRNFYIYEKGQFKGKPMPKAPDELCFAYVYKTGVKIYLPLRDEYKWFMSAPNTIIEGLESVKDTSFLLITKSRKDRMVVSKFIKRNVVSSQNESRAFLTDKFKLWVSRFDRVILWFDADDPGLKAAQRILSEMGAKWYSITTPTHLLPKVKDPAGWSKKVNNDLTVLKKYTIDFMKSIV